MVALTINKPLLVGHQWLLKEYIMQDPKQLYLFNDMNYVDMESDDYEEAYFQYLQDTHMLDLLEEQSNDDF